MKISLLHGDVPLPGVRVDRVPRRPVPGDAAAHAEAPVRLGVAVEVAAAAGGVRERRVDGPGSGRRSGARAGRTARGRRARPSSRPRRRPRRRRGAGRSRVVLLVLQRAVRARRPAPEAGVLAQVRARPAPQAVAGVVAEGRVEERRDEARDLVVARYVVEEASSSARRSRRSRAGGPSRSRRRRTRGRSSAGRHVRRAEDSEKPKVMSLSRKSARMFPVVPFQPLRPRRAPEVAVLLGAVAAAVSSFFSLELARTPALKKCLPKTAE